jgi:predicted peptidase
MRTFDSSLFALSILAICATCAAADGSTPAEAGKPNQSAKHFSTTATKTIDIDYLLFLPQGYEADKNKKWPLILFLHGAGERGTNVWKVATHGPPKNVAEHPDFPFIVVSPQCPEKQVWSNEVLLGLLEEAMKKCQVDPSRVYLTGLSMGGYGTWNLGLAYPEKFAAIAPICGGGQMISVLLSGGERGAALKTLGIWAFHGAKDPVVPVAESQRMVDAVKKAGVTDVKFTIYPEAQHNSWVQAYEDPELYKWFLEHKRGAAR